MISLCFGFCFGVDFVRWGLFIILRICCGGVVFGVFFAACDNCGVLIVLFISMLWFVLFNVLVIAL